MYTVMFCYRTDSNAVPVSVGIGDVDGGTFLVVASKGVIIATNVTAAMGDEEVLKRAKSNILASTVINNGKVCGQATFYNETAVRHFIKTSWPYQQELTKLLGKLEAIWGRAPS